jgi:hypothetical protein
MGQNSLNNKSNIERLKEILYGYATQEEIVFNIEKLIKKYKAEIKKSQTPLDKEKRYDELISAIEKTLQDLK